MRIYSPAFAYGTEIPPEFTCEGEDISPPLVFETIPRQAKSLALIVDDPDAPDPEAPQMTYVHWVVHNLPVMYELDPLEPECLPKGASGTDKMPEGAVEGYNDWERIGYGGPCPPIGRHRYYFKLYALDTTLPDKPMTKDELLQAMEGHILETAEHMGTYRKRTKEAA